MRFLLTLRFACSAALAACAAHSASHAGPASLYSMPRLVTLVPSFADDAYAIGAGAQLVGVSAFTDAPQAKALPRVADASSIDAEAIIALRPSLVVGIPAQSRLIEPVRRAGVRVVLLPDDSYASIFANLRALGSMTGHVRGADAIIVRLRRETHAIAARTSRYARRPSVFVVLGVAPIWTAGRESYISTLIALAGGANAAGDVHAAYSEYSAEALLRRQPDMLVADAAIGLDRAIGGEPWRSLRAVRLHRVYDVDPALIERPGPSYNAGLRWLADRVRPLAGSTP